MELFNIIVGICTIIGVLVSVKALRVAQKAYQEGQHNKAAISELQQNNGAKIAFQNNGKNTTLVNSKFHVK